MASNIVEGRITGFCLGSEVVEGVSKATGEHYRFPVTSVLVGKTVVEATLPDDVSILANGTPQHGSEVDFRVRFRAGANGRLNVNVLGEWSSQSALV